METLFTKIIRGDIPCYKVAEDACFFAFLDINPLAEGHTLVVPKNPVDYLFDMENQELGEMLVFAKKVAKSIKANFPCKKVGMTVVGLEVPHAHIHLIPINGVYDMDFQREKLKLPPQRFEEIAKQITDSIE
jgi:histidine triad (HIT) family protein